MKRKRITVTEKDIEIALNVPGVKGTFCNCPIYFAAKRVIYWPNLQVGQEYIYDGDGYRTSIRLPKKAAQLSRAAYEQRWNEVKPLTFYVLV